MNKEYQNFFDELHFAPAQKARIAALAAQTARKQTKPAGRGLHRLGQIAAAACLVMALTVSAEAAGIATPLSQLLGPLFGGSIAQCQVIDRIGYPVEAGDTDNGITVTAQAVIGDKYNACFVFSFSREDGEAILPEGIPVQSLQLGGFGDIELMRMGGSHGSARFVDLVPGDNEIHYLYFVSADAPLNRGTVKVCFENLYAYPEFSEHSRLILEGTWKFRFAVDYEDTSVSLGWGETFECDGIRFTVTEVLVSPIAVQVSYEADSQVQWSDAPSGRMPQADCRQVERYLENIPLILTKSDGTTLDLSGSGGGICPADGKTFCRKGTVLEEIVPLEELESITVGEIVYPVK